MKVQKIVLLTTLLVISTTTKPGIIEGRIGSPETFLSGTPGTMQRAGTESGFMQMSPVTQSANQQEHTRLLAEINIIKTQLTQIQAILTNLSANYTSSFAELTNTVNAIATKIMPAK